MSVIAQLLLVFAFSSSTMQDETYTYVDGNNNTYAITSTALDYIPVKKADSSSGTYSGGEPKKVVITKTQFAEIQAIIDRIEQDKVHLIPARNMGCGTLSRKNGKPIYIDMHSRNKVALEAELQTLLRR
jgi:hypothetical protein